MLRGLTKSQWTDIDKQNPAVFLFPGKDTALDSCAICDCFVWVDTLGGLLAVEVLLEKLLNLGDTSGAADKNDLEANFSYYQRSDPSDNKRLEPGPTSSISSFFTPASFSTCSTGFIVFRKRSMLSSSNLARVRVCPAHQLRAISEKRLCSPLRNHCLPRTLRSRSLCSSETKEFASPSQPRA